MNAHYDKRILEIKLKPEEMKDIRHLMSPDDIDELFDDESEFNEETENIARVGMTNIMQNENIVNKEADIKHESDNNLINEKIVNLGDGILKNEEEDIQIENMTLKIDDMQELGEKININNEEEIMQENKPVEVTEINKTKINPQEDDISNLLNKFDKGKKKRKEKKEEGPVTYY